MSDLPAPRLESEHRRLLNGPDADEKPGGLGTVRFVVECDGNPNEVLRAAKSLLLDVNRAGIGPWPMDSDWETRLPSTFLSRCGPDLTEEEAEAEMSRRRSLPPDEHARVERNDRWGALSWVYWFQPERRTWFWWDAVCVDSNTILVAVEVYDWPFPWGALAWLLRGSGASSVEAEAQS